MVVMIQIIRRKSYIVIGIMFLTGICYMVSYQIGVWIGWILLIVVNFILFPVIEKYLIKNEETEVGKIIDIESMANSDGAIRVYAKFMYFKKEYFISATIYDVPSPKIGDDVTVIIDQDNVENSIMHM